MKRLSLLTLLVMLLASLGFSQEGGDDMKVPPRGKKARIQVITDPPNSDVYLGGKFLGKSPINNMEVTSGRHNLVVVDQGYELVNIRFNVWPDSLNVYSGKTVIPKGHVEVTTVPNRCDVKLDGEYADHTDGGPLTLRNLDAGDHLITVQCGKKSKDQMIQIKGEETLQITVDVNKK